MITSSPLRAKWADNKLREAILLFKDVCALMVSREFEFEFDGMKITSCGVKSS